MSHDLVGAALWLDMAPTRKLVLVALCDRADLKTGECWPGRKEIAFRSSLTPRNVTPHLQSLEKDGWVRSGERPYRARFKVDSDRMTTTRWVNVTRILKEGEGRRGELQALWRAGDDSSPGDTKAGDDSEKAGDGDAQKQGMIDAKAGDDATLVTVTEPSLEPPLEPSGGKLSDLDIRLRENYAQSQKGIALRGKR